jgi:alkylation response protein AidB-like acyl-CoA dehydrogenase
VDFELPDDERALQRLVREFATTRVKPGAAERDRTHSFPAGPVEEMAGLGLLGMMIPTAYGGAGLGTLAYALAIEEISRADAALGTITAVHNSVATYPILLFGDEGQKERYLPQLASGRRIGAFCLSEAASGSDAQAMEAVARKQGDHYVLDGTKLWVTNGREAGLFIVFARTPEFERPGSRRSISAFIVESGTPGVSVSRTEEKMGLRSSDTCEVLLEGVALPSDAMIGDPGTGFGIAMATLDGGRIGIGAQATGIGAAALEDALAYAKVREQFGRSLGAFQAVQWKLADAAVRLEAARLLVRQAAWRKDQGMPFTQQAACAKLFATTAAREICSDMLQVLGGVGYTSDYAIERYFRDVKVTEIYEGTSEIQRSVIARSVLGKR